MIGVNILAQFVRDRGALSAWLKRAQPGAVLVMDDPPLAQTIQRDLPGATVIHRTYHPDDHRWHDVITPAGWLAAHSGTAGNGVLAQVFNEPAPGNSDAFLNWIAELVRLCPPTLALALPAFAVGNPNEEAIINGGYDRLLRLLAGSRHVLLLHEYFRNDPAAEYPYLCGRFRFWLERAKTLGIAPPRIVLGEYGRDVGGGVNDGWRGAGWSEARYLELLTATHRSYYAPYGVPVCVFGYGGGAAGRWASFDIEGANGILSRLAEYNAMSTAFVDGIIASVAAGYVNVRVDKSVSATILKQFYVNNAVRYNPAAEQGGAYSANGKTMTTWYALEGGGYIAAGVVQIREGTAVPDTPIKRMGAPFVSQLGTGANLLNNDCPEAVSLSGIHWSHLKSRRRLMRGLTINMLARGRGDDTQPPSYIVNLLNEFGVDAAYTRPLTPDIIAQQMEADRLPILLVNYQYIGGERFGHYVVVNAYGTRGFWIHDPYRKGADVYLTRETLNLALSDVGGFATYSHQGVVLT